MSENIDYIQQERQDSMSPTQHAIRAQVLDGAPKATFTYINCEYLNPHEGWLVGPEGDLLFAFSTDAGYDHYHVEDIRGVYVTVGTGPCPIGYTELVTEWPTTEENENG